MIYKHLTPDPHVRVPNETAQDPNLKIKDLGLLTRLLSLPPDWRVHVTTLSRRFQESHSTITASLKRLSEAGYVHKEQRRGEDGRIAGWDWHVFAAKSLNPYASEPDARNPHVENPHVENPHVENVDLQSKERTKKTVNKRNRKSRPQDFDEVVAYFASRNASEAEARRWLDRQEACGWVFGKGHLPVKDWQASARTWIGNITQYSPQQNGHAPRTTAAERSAGITLESVAGSANRLVALLDDADG